ncbi:hypothetical protein EIP86_007834 [Pleurotus ostreatoroseus]|nr:hypothetical protein EIP86_007834 [Pleurotus ostreatoroseus]
MDIEVIDVDAFEPEITAGRQGRRTLRAVLIPSGRPKPKPKPEEIIDLTADDDDDLHVAGPSTSRTMSSNGASTARVPKTSVSRPQEGSSRSAPTSRATTSKKTRLAPPSTSKGKTPVKPSSMAAVSQPYRKVGPPRGVKPDSPMSSRSSLARPRSARPANASSNRPHDSEREAEDEWDTYHDGLHINRQSNWNNRVSILNDEMLGEHNLYEDLEAAQQDAQDSVYSHVKARARHAIRSIHKPFGEPILSTVKPPGMLGKMLRDVFSQAEYTSVQKNVLDHNSIHKVTARARRRCTRNITHYAHAKEAKYLGMLPGAVNSISQSGDLTAITSCVPGGSVFSDPGMWKIHRAIVIPN